MHWRAWFTQLSEVELKKKKISRGWWLPETESTVKTDKRQWRTLFLRISQIWRMEEGSKSKSFPFVEILPTYKIVRKKTSLWKCVPCGDKELEGALCTAWCFDKLTDSVDIFHNGLNKCFSIFTENYNYLEHWFLKMGFTLELGFPLNLQRWG